MMLFEEGVRNTPFSRSIEAIDTHTAGECTRMVTAGLPAIAGTTIAEKLAYASLHLPWAPGFLMLEPRGHMDMFGAVLVPPCDPEADAGVIFMDNCGYEPMCGHGVIGVVTTLVETGMVVPHGPDGLVTLDTAAGLVRAYAKGAKGRVTEVTFENAPAFVWRQAVRLDLNGHGPLEIDVAFGGNFFALVRAEQLGLELVAENAHRLAALGMRILQAANEQVAVRHPDLPHIDRIIDLRFYVQPGYEGGDSRNVVVLGDHMVDRSPCGTGTCAEMALRYAQGILKPGQPWVVESIIGTRFTGMVAGAAQVGQGPVTIPAIIPRITGSASITGWHRLVLDDLDPFPDGFSLSRRG